MPKVSVIIPCYNQGQYLDEAVASVLRQTYQDFEIIVVNDGSTDEYTRTLLNAYDTPKTTVIHTTNQGLSRARNNGIRAAQGDYILPLDADDRIGTRYVEEAVNVLDTDPDIGIVYCLTNFFGQKKGAWILPSYSLEALLLDNIIFVSSFFRKKDWEAVGGFNSNMKYCYEDWDFWLSLVELGRKVYRIPRVLFYYRVTDASMMNSATEDQIIDMGVQLFHNHENLYVSTMRTNPRPFVAGSLRYQKLVDGILNSRSWKWTRPLRVIGSFFMK
jgi:glycosyltransferase involved in cell wall biosynthesis